MTSVVSYHDLQRLDNFSVNLNDFDDAQSAKGLSLQRDYGQFLLGLVVGVFLTLAVGYWYRGGINFPRPATTVDVVDSGSQDRPTSVGTLRVRGTNVRMRSCPGLNCREIARLQTGTRVSDLGQAEFVGDQEWIRVRVGDQEGWVDRYLLE
jgi:hypothetical protein